jgi:hypothetical protein
MSELQQSPQEYSFSGDTAAKLIAEFRQMGMQLHTYHSNAGQTHRMKEWSTCRYHYCRDRFALAYPNGLPNNAELIQ